MNAVEIEEAVSELVVQPFDRDEFPFQFLSAFGAKDTSLKRLRKGDSNQSDVGGVLWRGNIHIAVAPAGAVTETLTALRNSPKTGSAKAKFILATDGETVEAEDLVGGDVIACALADLPRHFATFLPLAGISTVKEIKNNPIDVKATGRLNKLYVELLKDNPDWATEERRHELNQFMARLIFCFFAEDTGIFREGQFTATIAQMSHAGHGSGAEEWGNTHEVLTELFRAMDTPVTHQGNFDDRYRRAARIRPYADVFPYVNGGLFTGATESPRFSRTARAYLLRAGELDWKEINPDIFGSMIQAVADDGERGELGMHYTSVPNILKVLNPLFLDSLREQLEAAGDSRQKLRNLRRRLGSIRVFDPACGSGNFLVIAYKEMRAIEAEIVRRLGGEANLKLDERRSVIPLSNFYGIEIKGFAAEIARLALLIAEFQADCLYLSQQEARAMVLPLHKTGQITVGNALRLDWLEVCPPVRMTTAAEHDLGGPTGRLALEENALEGGDAETYICGNPPYVGARKQGEGQKDDLRLVYADDPVFKDADYVSGWLLKALNYGSCQSVTFGFVTTSSVCQGEQVQFIWPRIWQAGLEIAFCYVPFKWTNNASNNAGVFVTVVGVRPKRPGKKYIFEGDTAREVANISPYLTSGPDLAVTSAELPISPDIPKMIMGNMARDDGNLILEAEEAQSIIGAYPRASSFVKRLIGTREIVSGTLRYCLWLSEEDRKIWGDIEPICARVNRVEAFRLASRAKTTNGYARIPYRFAQRCHQDSPAVVVPSVTPEDRLYVTPALIDGNTVVTNLAYIIYNFEPWLLAILSSRLHLVWNWAVSGRHGSGVRYTPTVSYHSFPVPKLTSHQKLELEDSAARLMLAREAHFPSSIDELYDPEAMPDDLRRAHDENDEVLERIYIGRRFRNDTERLEKLFDLYTRMTANAAPKSKMPRKPKQAA